jgi:hypothetical protein
MVHPCRNLMFFTDYIGLLPFNEKVLKKEIRTSN